MYGDHKREFVVPEAWNSPSETWKNCRFPSKITWNFKFEFEWQPTTWKYSGIYCFLFCFLLDLIGLHEVEIELF